MSRGDYSDFCQDVLVACADAQSGDRVAAVNISQLCKNEFPDVPPTWVETVTSTLVEHGFGDDWSTLSSRQFYIRGPGLLEVEAIRKLRRPKTLTDRVRSVSRSDWIALGAFIVSLVALFK